MQSGVIEIKFKGQRRETFANLQQIPFKVGDYAVVQAEKGLDLGRVNHISGLMIKPDDGKKQFKKVIRKSSANDLQQRELNLEKEQAALRVCKDKLKNHKLTMKLVDCEYQFDGKKITFHFTSDNRVDFRRLVKDVAAVYKTRIEFRQIGVRDEARRLGGYGVCGQQLCCSRWIKDFMPVTTQAAKDQNLSLNPTKLAGVCGRLKCCLMYERGFYNYAIKQFPQLAKPIVTAQGDGIVSNIDIFHDKVIVLYPDDTTETLTLEEVKKNVYKCDSSCGHEPEVAREIAKAGAKQSVSQKPRDKSGLSEPVEQKSESQASGDPDKKTDEGQESRGRSDNRRRRRRGGRGRRGGKGKQNRQQGQGQQGKQEGGNNG